VSADTLATVKSTASQEAIALGLLQAAGVKLPVPIPEEKGPQHK
jgi:hypothetical protein